MHLTAALGKSGVSLQGFRGALSQCEIAPTGNGLPIRAQEVADWLTRRPFPGLQRPRTLTPGDGFADKLAGLTGIIFFQHYWLRDGEKLNQNPAAPYGTGNHIDLWNRSRLPMSTQTVLRFYLHINTLPDLDPRHRGPFARTPVEPGHNWYSDLNHASNVVFWQLA